MRPEKILLLLPVIILIALGAVAGCGGSSGMGSDGVGEPGGSATCPCFSQDEVVNIAQQTTSIECVNSVFGLILLYNDANSTR